MKWLSQNYQTVVDLTLIHLAISVPAILASLAVAIPAGWLVRQRRWLLGPTVALASGVYAVPSLPLLVLVPVLLGTSLRAHSNVIVVLALYALALLIRTAIDAFGSVPQSARDAALAMGYTQWRLFWTVDLPLAGPVIVAGLRVVAVATVSLVTIGSVIGIQSLGTLFTDGFQRGIAAEVLTGLVMTIALALALDVACARCGRLLLPWASPRTRRGRAS